MQPHVYEWMVRSQLIRADGIGRRCKLRKCGSCGDHIVRGLDGDVCAVVVSTSAGPICTKTEIAALVLGRKTYDLITILGAKTFPAFELVESTPARIRRTPRYDILATHVCNSTLPTIPSRVYR